VIWRNSPPSGFSVRPPLRATNRAALQLTRGHRFNCGADYSTLETAAHSTTSSVQHT
jgi:hypothetical protein